MISSFPNSLGQHAEDLSDMREAELDEDGLIECPVIPLRDMVMYPHMMTPLLVGREQSLAALGAASRNKETAIAVAQIDASDDKPDEEALFRIGSEIAVGRSLRMPDGTMSVFVQGRRRVEIVEFIQVEPYFRVKARPIEIADQLTPEAEALMRAVLALFEKCVELNRSLPEEAYVYAMNVDSPGWLADLVASTLNIGLPERQGVLETFAPIARLQQVSALLGSELNVLELEDRIHAQVQEKVDRTQREFYLREQMKAIQTELGEGDVWAQELGELREKITAAGMPEEVHKRAFKEVERLQQMPPMAPEAGVIRTYLDWLIDLPWWETTEDNLDLQHAQEILDRQHFGLPKAKDRILEYMAVRSLTGDRGKVR
ncbi:MAG: LON peptidase substrate-binding domain-containing protein, partial [Anaerolineales bacterium]